jgi:hypothetical protein
VKALKSLPDFPADGSVKTLGFDVIRWIHRWLLQPDGDEAGSPFRLTREQKVFLLWFYAVDERGKFVFRRGVLRRAKGWGKSPFVGAMCLAELCGPVRFGGWKDNGQPWGERHPFPWVAVAGVSETQTENTFAAIRAMVEDSDLVDVVGLDVGLTRIFVPGGGKLVPITASSSTQEGARPTFCVMDETHHWTESNGGAKLARVIRRNLAKSRDGAARALETTNAHEPGQESVAEASYLAWRAMEEGRAKKGGLLYDCLEAPASVDLSNEEELVAALKATYGDATWIDIDRLLGEVYDPDTPPEEARRFYLNQIVAAADAWVTPGEWEDNYSELLEPLAAGDTVTLGFDGSLTDDSTALVAVRVSDGAPFILGLWEKPPGANGNVGKRDKAAGTAKVWEVDKDDVRGHVDHAFSTYDVVAFFADVAYWETDVDAWREEYGERLLVKATTRHSVAWDMRSKQGETVRSVEALHRAITDGELPHDGDSRLTRHVLNARRRPNRYGVSFGKSTRESPDKVDALAALVLARMARTRVLGEGVLKKRRGKVGSLVGF